MSHILPKKDPGWVAYIWLVYLIFFLWSPITDHASARQWTVTGIGLTVFLLLYFTFFHSGKPWNRLCLAGIVLLGVVYAPFNGGAA
jgi:hypothetical protein